VQLSALQAREPLNYQARTYRVIIRAVNPRPRGIASNPMFLCMLFKHFGSSSHDLFYFTLANAHTLPDARFLQGSTSQHGRDDQKLRVNLILLFLQIEIALKCSIKDGTIHHERRFAFLQLLASLDESFNLFEMGL